MTPTIQTLKGFGELDAYYTAARRQAFMMEKLAAGKHPDTDADFWRGFDGGSPPPLPGSGHWGLEGFVRVHPELAVMVTMLAALAAVRWLRRRASRP